MGYRYVWFDYRRVRLDYMYLWLDYRCVYVYVCGCIIDMYTVSMLCLQICNQTVQIYNPTLHECASIYGWIRPIDVNGWYVWLDYRYLRLDYKYVQLDYKYVWLDYWCAWPMYVRLDYEY